MKKIEIDKMTEPELRKYITQLKSMIATLQFTLRRKSDVRWRAMDTAPKDGTVFLGCTTTKGVFSARMKDRKWCNAYTGEALHLSKWMPLPETD